MGGSSSREADEGLQGQSTVNREPWNDSDSDDIELPVAQPFGGAESEVSTLHISCEDMIMVRSSLPAVGLHHCADDDSETGVLLVAPGETVNLHSLQSQTSQLRGVRVSWCVCVCLCVCVCNM